VNFVADEGIDGQIVRRLRGEGHAVIYVAEMDPGVTDDVVLSRANEQGATLLTTDKDFGELVFRQRRVSSAVILIRLSGLPPDRKARIVASVVSEHEAELSQDTFAVVTPGAVRIRKEAT
jgi:predicted nuclease of predicted toxin-antitoxin system